MTWLVPLLSAARSTARRSPSVQATFIRTRTDKVVGRKLPPRRGSPPTQHAKRTLAPVKVGETWSAFLRGAETWSASTGLKKRLALFGLQPNDGRKFVTAYVKALKRGDVAKSLYRSSEELDRIRYDFAHPGSADPFDVHMTKVMFEWAASPDGRADLQRVISPQALSHIVQLFEAADLSQPPSWYSMARRRDVRKIIMHVGPTNSGKTHNALRALAAARTGAYAGPLRLLAHEIWDRLNKGQIVPLGAEPTAEPDEHTNIEVGDSPVAPVVQKLKNPQFARLCNLITGEEQRILDQTAPLVSCTVEMLSTARLYDVVVVDEIQMIADPERGYAWTNALLGVNASEVHLCGEETAVPLVEAILRDTGDELVVNRYQRLSSLRVADKSLDGKLASVEKGDCVVAFSRKKIFALKTEIEKKKKIRCAVAYGRLPPELRSEQAALFNDPKSGYNVLVATDAVGMGLNLKIKRVILEAVAKYDGTQMRRLSDSQIKQIGGRAGRFGLHGDDPNAGVVTTLHESDLSTVRKAFQRGLEPLQFARMNPMNTPESLQGVMQVLPKSSPMHAVGDVYQYVAKIHPRYVLVDLERIKERMHTLQKSGGALTIDDHILFMTMPLSDHDELGVAATEVLMKLHRTEIRVPIMQTLEESGLWDAYQRALEVFQSGAPLDEFAQNDAMKVLESMHKFVVTYLWLTWRQPVGFPDQERTLELKTECEAAMNWCLEQMSARGYRERNVQHVEEPRKHHVKKTTPRESSPKDAAPKRPAKVAFAASKPRQSSSRELSAQ